MSSQINSSVKRGTEKYVVYFLFFFILVLAGFSDTINQISLYLFIPSLFIYSFIKNPKLILSFKPLLYFLAYIIWSIITVAKAIHIKESIKEIKLLLGAFALSYIIVFFSKLRIKNIYIFYLYYILMFFVLYYKGASEGLLNSQDTRFNTTDINANLFGYVGFFSILSALFIWRFSFRTFQFYERSKIFYFAVLIICAILSITASFFAASRAGIFISMFAFLFGLALNYLYPFKRKTLIYILFLALTIYSTVPSITSLVEKSTLAYRIQSTNIENESRSKLLITAFKTGIENPIFGVGSGNFIFYSGIMQFSHSTYFEIFANNGIIGLFLFLLIYKYYLKKNFILYALDQKYKKGALYFFVFIFLYLIYNVFYVFHTSPFLISFLFLVTVHLDIFLNKSIITEQSKFYN